LNGAVLSALLMALFSALILPGDLPAVRAAQELTPTANTWMPYYNGNYTNTPPQNRTRHVAVWDALDNIMLVHGGFDVNGKSLNDTWKLDTLTGTWTQYTAATGGTPPTRVNGCAVWDTSHNRMLVVGGSNYAPPYSALNIVWSFDPSGNGNWTAFSSATGNAPTEGQEGQACVWDPANSKMIVYGGLSDDTVWSFDPSGNGSWTELLTPTAADCSTTPPANRPGWRRYVSYVWNPDLNRMIIWSGRKQCATGNVYYNDVWSFNPGNYTDGSGSWTKVTTTGGPPAQRDRAAMVWDPTLHQMVIFGSVDETNTTINTYYNDVWQFKLDTASSGRWTKRITLGTAPGIRADDSGVYDPLHNQILYFAGRIPSDGGTTETRINELWGLGAAPTQFGLKFASSAFSIPAGTISGQLQIQLTDASGNNTTNTTGSAITVYLSASPTPSGACAAPGCGFSTDPNGITPAFTPTLNITIASGQGLSDIFYYRDTKAGSIMLSANAALAAIGAGQQETITPGSASKLIFSTQPPATTNAGTAFATAPKVTVQDSFSNTVTSPAVSVSLTLQGGDPTAVLNGTTTQNTVNGIATFSGLSVSKGSANPYQLQASIAGPITVTSNNFTINVTQTLNLVFANSPFSITAGNASEALSINLTNGSGTVVNNTTGAAISITVSSNAATGRFSTSAAGPFTQTTLSLSIASNASATSSFYYSDTKAGSPVLNVTTSANGVNGTSQTETITPATASKLVFTQQPSSPTNANAAFATQPQVAVQDTYGNTVSTSGTAVTLTLQGGDPTAVLNGTTTQNTTSGVATFSGLSVSKGSANPYQLQASITGPITATSNNFTINTVCDANSTIVTVGGDPTLPVADPCQISLRQAILNANTNGGTVTFAANLLTSTGTGALQTISLNSALPALAANVKIDAGCNTTAIAGRGRPTIAIDGTGAGQNVSGFTLNAGTQTSAPGNGNTIKGLAIVNFKGYGIDISSAGNTITCSYIGTDDGTSAKPNLQGGINITGLAAQGANSATVINTFGLVGNPASGNVIAGTGGANSKPAIQASGLGAKNYLYYNYINYNAAGTSTLTGSQAGQVTPLKFSNRARLVMEQGNKERR
jgi:hypothetical protein